MEIKVRSPDNKVTITFENLKDPNSKDLLEGVAGLLEVTEYTNTWNEFAFLMTEVVKALQQISMMKIIASRGIPKTVNQQQLTPVLV